jgi:hypothetical protein
VIQRSKPTTATAQMPPASFGWGADAVPIPEAGANVSPMGGEARTIRIF